MVGEVVFSLQGWPLVPKHSSFLSLNSRKRRVFSFNTSEGLASGWRWDSGPYYLDPLPDELFLGRLVGASLRSQASSSGSTLVSVIYGYIDEVLMTNPCQWGRGA